MKHFFLHRLARIRALTNGEHHFFGYYDKSPWSPDHRFLLTHQTDFLDRLPSVHDLARIKVIDTENQGEEKIIADTHAWNFQQGSGLQWVGKEGHLFVFNDFQNGHFVSILYSLDDHKKTTLPYPVYALHPDGRKALFLNFSRLQIVREGYGYNSRDTKTELPSLESDGIWGFDLVSPNEKKLIISLAALRGVNPIKSMQEGEHWVDHITFNPSGDRFLFFHRWQTSGSRMYTRLYTANTDGSDLFLLIDTGMASHFSWKNDSEILVWARPRGVAESVVRNRLFWRLFVPIYHRLFAGSRIRQKISGDGFLLFQDRSSFFNKIGEGVLTEDGHCSFSPDRKWLLTDTYASKDHMRRLILYNLLSKKVTEVGSFYALPEQRFLVGEHYDSSSIRTDLHPRFSPDGTRICIDSVHEGSRQMYEIDVSRIVGGGVS